MPSWKQCPAFAAEVEAYGALAEEPAYVDVMLKRGGYIIGPQHGEWLHARQMAEAKQRERVRHRLSDVLGAKTLHDRKAAVGAMPRCSSLPNPGISIAERENGYDHVYETLKIGIDTLAAGTGSIQERLWETWMVIHPLNEDDLPLELRDDFHKLSEALTTAQESAIEAEPDGRKVSQARGAYEGLDNDHARKLALFIVQLFTYASAEFWPTHKKTQSKPN